MQLKRLQETFLNCLRDEKQLDNLSGALIQGTIDIKDRMEVYRNQLYIGLRSTLEETYPLCYKLIGGEAFKIVTRDYVNKFIPKQAVLTHYGDSFPEHLATYDTLIKAAPYLRDVAYYEWACHEVYYARQEASFTDFSGLSEEEFADLQISLKSATKIIQSSYPLILIAEYLNSQAQEQLTYEEGRYYFIIHRDDEVEVEEIEELYYKALQSFPIKLKDLTTFFIDEKGEDKFQQFLQSLFQKKLIKQP